MSKNVIALDPGNKVGWARATVLEDGTWSNMRHGITPLRDMAISLAKNLIVYDVVIVEDWRLYPNKAREMVGSSFPSVQFIGMVKLLTWLNPTVKYVTQGASVMKIAEKSLAACRPELHAQVVTPRAHDDAHDMSALLHLWYWTWRTYPIGLSKEAA
jgi:hypothetical protein